MDHGKKKKMMYGGMTRKNMKMYGGANEKKKRYECWWYCISHGSTKA